MMQSLKGAKRPRDEAPNKPLLVPGLTLSQHHPEQRKCLFINKLKKIVIAKSLHPTEFEGYTIRERFMKMGWEQLLDFDYDKIYRRVVIQWTASLSRNGDELTGIVDGKSYTITPAVIRDLLKVDTHTDSPYVRFNEADLQTTTDENKKRWLEACKTVFGSELDEDGISVSEMTPLMKILWKIGVWTFHPRLEDTDYVWPREIYLIHALYTGDYLYSFAHLMIDDIWEMYEDENQQILPHGYYISEILSRLGAISEDEYVEMVAPRFRLISRRSFFDLDFSESPTEYIIDDRVLEQRVTFLKKVKEREASPQPPRYWMPVLNPHADMTNSLRNLKNLIIKQSSPSQKRFDEIVTMVYDMQKHMERQALEAEEREKKAEIRAHAIIWDIERQRYIYEQEQEQEQLRMAWNQGNCVNGVDEFQFPRMSQASFHPPRLGSRYYDLTQSNEIPEAFQSLYQDIYGPRS